MELFDKKFVRFMWDDELEGKEVFVADNINSLIERVEKGASIYKVRWSRDNGMPFESDDLVRYRFAYYDPNYEAKRAFNEGKEIQFKDDVSGDWCSAYNPRWDLNIEYRIKPEEDEKRYRPYKDSTEIIADFIARFKVDCPPYCEPSIWLKGKDVDRQTLVSSFREDSVSIDFNPFIIGFEQLLDDYTYLDGSPVGVLDE